MPTDFEPFCLCPWTARGLQGDPKGFGMNPGDYGLGNFTLTDQFGHTYVPNGVGTPNMIPFRPLTWPASSVGARLTLHVTSIEAMWLQGTGEVQGDWSLHATLVAEQAHTLAIPARVHTAQADYAFTSIRSSTTTLDIQWTVQGPALDRVNGLWAAAGDRTNPQVPPSPPSVEQTQLQHDYFWAPAVRCIGPARPARRVGITFTNPARGDLTGFIPGPGRYRIQLGDALTADDLQRWIVVP